MQEADYEADIHQLQQVWKDSPKKASHRGPSPKAPRQVSLKAPRQVSPKAPRQVSAKGPQICAKGPRQVSAKKTNTVKHRKNVLLSTKHRQPMNGEQVIEVSTHPQHFHNKSSDILHKQLNSHTHKAVPTGKERTNLSQVQSLRREIEQKDKEISILRVTNSTLSDRMHRLQQDNADALRQVDSLKRRQCELVSKTSSLMSKETAFSYGKVEYENYRADSRRLLKMLQQTAQYRHFAQFALQDNGVRFLHQVKKKSKVDTNSGQHYCACNQQFIAETDLWVPQDVYQHGKTFLKDKDQLTHAQLQLLMYELNRIYREREKKITNSLHALNAHDVAKYKRKIKEMKGNDV